MAVGCFPSTPVIADIWYDIQALQLYQRLGLLEGLSATGGFNTAVRVQLMRVASLHVAMLQHF
jgi:hypothetical protein